MLKWLRQFDWVAIFGSALVLVLALWFLQANPDNEANPTAYKQPFEYIFGILPPEGWTALFTGALFISTLALWDATRKAVKVSNRTLNELERPWLFVTDSEAGGIFGDPPFVNIQLLNYGRTVGEIRFVRAGIRRTSSPNMEIETIGMNRIESAEVGNVIPPTKPHTVTLRFPPHRDERTPVLVDAGDVKFILRAEIHYTGLLKEPGITAFCFLYDASKRQFARCGGEEYNYTK